jgi:hypothetical protein
MFEKTNKLPLQVLEAEIEESEAEVTPALKNMTTEILAAVMKNFNRCLQVYQMLNTFLHELNLLCFISVVISELVM